MYLTTQCLYYVGMVLLATRKQEQFVFLPFGSALSGNLIARNSHGQRPAIAPGKKIRNCGVTFGL
jgi:hypothetical protein